MVFRGLLQDQKYGGWRGHILRVLAAPFAIHGVVIGAGVAWTVWAKSQAGAIRGGLPLLPS